MSEGKKNTPSKYFRSKDFHRHIKSNKLKTARRSQVEYNASINKEKCVTTN